MFADRLPANMAAASTGKIFRLDMGYLLNF